MALDVFKKRAEARTRYYVREEAARVGWDIRHPSNGGHFLEEQEIVDYFRDLKTALKTDKPDFAFVMKGKLRAVIECKNDWRDLEKAVSEAQGYADVINTVRTQETKLAIGVAGTPDKRVHIRGSFRRGNKWVDLKSHDFPLTQIPVPIEVETALANDNGTTDVQLPNEREFFSAAISISRILRLAKIEESVRPKVIGAIILALYHGEFSLDPDVVIENINTNVRAAVKTFGDSIPRDRRDFLSATLELSTEAHRLRPGIEDVVHQLERLNVRSIMRSGVDFLGKFYETFLRYGQDTKKLGIVFTPRHITRFCADLINTELGNVVYDPACGTGGFLVAAFDRMMRAATTSAARTKVKESLYGFDTNSTVWALAVLNMFFRGDGKSNITYGDCFEHKKQVAGKFDRVLLNPPFSQQGEPETDFIDHALAAVKPGGRVAVVVKGSVMVERDLGKWRRDLVAKHHVEGVITLPAELFYPTAAPTVILIVRGHAPDLKRGTFLAAIKNDGFEISKKRRVPIEGSQLDEVLTLFRRYERTGTIETIPNVAMVIDRASIANGEEICAERWLPSGTFKMAAYESGRRETLKQLSLGVANYPEVVEQLLDDYESTLSGKKRDGRPVARAKLSEWFSIRNGKSSGSKNYPPGPIPYISSGASYNGIVEFVEASDAEIYTEPKVSVSCFGPAYLQPWKFCARGNGGSAVRILSPRFAMSVPELLWFVAQINSQNWRFHFGRMALPERLSQLEVDPPPSGLPELAPLKNKLTVLHWNIHALMEVQGASLDEEDLADIETASNVLSGIRSNPEKNLVQGVDLRKIITRLERE